MSSNRAKRILTVADARAKAKRALPPVLFDYIEGGAEAERTLRDNERIFTDLRLRPRMGVDVDPSVGTSVLGTQLSLPVMLAPMGMIQLFHPHGAIGAARAAAASGTVAILSRTAMCPPAEVAKHADGPLWYQITSLGGREGAGLSIRQAAQAGYTVLVVTLDGPPPGNRQAELRHRVMPPVQPSLGLFARLAAQGARRPGWTLGMLATAKRQRQIVASTSQTLSSNQLHRAARFTWDDIAWLRSEWKGALVVKGILCGEDAVAAKKAGADAVIVSNHGGRALDGAPASLAVLPEVVAALGPSTEVLLDGGIRWAGDVAKALCLGARAVLIGRPFVYGLACAGQPGVERIIEIFRSELVRTMRLMGCPDLASLDARWIQDGAWPRPEPTPALEPVRLERAAAL